MLDTLNLKRCPQCGETKDVSLFPRNRRTKDGFHCWCKACCNSKTSAKYHTDENYKKYILDYANGRYSRIKDNPDFIRKHNLDGYNRRAAFFGVEGSITEQELIDLENDYGGLCAYCGKEAEEIDHVIPLSRGGTNSIDNIVPCCAKCNDLKHNTPLLVWMWKTTQSEMRRP